MEELFESDQFNDRFTFLERIGRGGMGEVFLAEDKLFPGRLCAIKVKVHESVPDARSLTRFRKEVESAKAVMHPYVVQVFEYFETPEIQAYSMEFINGGNLRQLMTHETVRFDVAMRLLKEVAEALAAIHSHHITHRDLKPENILLTSDRVVKVADFGVARSDDSSTITQLGRVVGTPKYLPPEYIEAGETDRRGDIYAFGVIAYELLSGTYPFAEGNMIDLLNSSSRTLVPPLHKICRDVPAEVSSIVSKAMSINLQKRYQSAELLISDLETVMEASGTSRLKRFLMKLTKSD